MDRSVAFVAHPPSQYDSKTQLDHSCNFPEALHNSQLAWHVEVVLKVSVPLSCKSETENSIKIAIRIRFDSIHSISDSIRFGLLFEIHNSVRLGSTDSIFGSIRLIHNRISYFLFSVVLIMCACKNGCLFLLGAHCFLVLEFISHRIIIVQMKISTTKKRINTHKF